MDEQNKNQNNDQPTKKRNSAKLVVVAIIAGLVGGGIAYGGADMVQNYASSGNSLFSSSSSNSGATVVNQSKTTGSSSATKAYNKVKGAVVSVINLQESQSSGSTLEAYGQTDDSTSNSSSSSLEAASEGSGIIYKKADGSAYIVTNNHVVSGSSSLEVILNSGKKVTATLVGTDKTTDLAVLKISDDNVTTVASFANSNQISAGQSVLAIGSPLGTTYASSVTKGIISAKSRSITTSYGKATVIQTDAAINAGNSGGPLINLSGQVVGINSMKLASDTDGTSVEGMGFSIPSNKVVEIVNKITSE
ncbi:S1C family serine protease [Paucilactobacillus kaifaensis]|uniref:S1C family serine protease n=1 Tax=Paucilactobacillus kaifaensis TaxID=2559921 RepID=UPI0010F71F72|nr:trypsin-like peptidase domain-containing protein [Paucilactobacillus kaifaensis]